MSHQISFPVISRTAFLIVGGDGAYQERLERYLLMQRAARVFIAQDYIVALRIIQDRKSQVSCVICKSGDALQFLYNLRRGRWGGSTVKALKFILMTDTQDVALIRRAAALNANGVIVGMPPRDELMGLIVRAVTSPDPVVPLHPVPAAHIMYAGKPMLAVPLDDGYDDLADHQKAHIAESIVEAAEDLESSAHLVLMWRSRGGALQVRAQSDISGSLKGLTLDAIRSSCNYRLLIELPSNDEPIPETEVHEYGGDQDDLTGTSIESNARKYITPVIIGRVITGGKKMGAEDYFARFVRSQSVVVGSDGRLVRKGDEYYTDLATLAEAFFPEVNMHLPGPWFPDLLSSLDSLFMQSFPQKRSSEVNVTVNFRIRSLRTPQFGEFLKKIDASSLVVELSQADIVDAYEHLLSIQPSSSINRSTAWGRQHYV